MAVDSRVSSLCRFLRPYRGRMTAAVALTVVLSVLAMLPPLIIRGLIDRVITARRTELFVPLAGCLFLVPAAAAACQYLQTLGIAYVGQRFVFDIRDALYTHLLGLSSRFYGQRSAGMLVNRLMGDSGIVQTVLTAQTINVVSDLVCATFAVSATLAINWRLALIVLVIVTTFLVNYHLNIARIRTATRGYQGAMDRLSGGIQNRLAAAVAVKSFGTEAREHGQFCDTLGDSLARVQEALTASNTFSMNTQLIQQLGRAVVYFLGCAMVLTGELSYGSVVAFTAYAMQLLMPAVRFSEIARQFQDVRIAVDRLQELFAAEPEITSGPDAVRLTHMVGHVTFDHVSFHYEPGQPVIRDFSLDVAPGTTVALIGPTGCGKSTILSLLLRFYDVCDGALRVDGHDVRELELHAFRQHFGIVLQDPILFSVSIADNIRYARPRASRADVEAAARMAEIHDFVAALPDGYDTRIGGDGVDLSVGQRQRMTIARAILADPRILIMDEATSALDSDSEKAIQRAMERALEARTCFIVAHRLSTIRNADMIVLLKDGAIAEQGRHDELMTRPRGLYRDLFNTHMGEGILKG